MEFAHLHGHSTFSFLEAVGTPKNIIKKAKELELKNIALTDLNGMFGAISFYQTAKENGINPIIGTEVGFVLDINGYNKLEDIGNICLIAKDGQGYNSLMKIVSHANQEGIAGKPKCDIKMLEKYNEGVVAFMGGEISWIGKMIFRSENDEKITEIINLLQEKLGKENVFLEIVAQNEDENEDLKKINKKILEFSKKLNIECVVNNIFHYINKGDKEIWEMALAIKDGNKMHDPHRRKPKGDFHLMTGQEIWDIMKKNDYDDELISRWIKNNNEIAKSANIEIEMKQSLFPNYPTPDYIVDLYNQTENDLLVDE